MDKRIEWALENMLRNYTEPFTAAELSSLMKKLGVKSMSFSKEDIYDFLCCDDRVFPLEGKTFITRAGAFTGAFFSFVPTQQELEQQLFVPGDRCIPFVDPEQLSCTLCFEYEGRPLPQAIFETDCNTARNLFTFYGDEYASQYIGADPVNEDLCLANNCYELPPKLQLTGVSIKRILKNNDFRKGDRILCRVKNWNKGIIEVFPLIIHDQNPFVRNEEKAERDEWITALENGLFGIFDKMGPCASMEQQLSYAFYENRSRLCRPVCGSLHEFLEKSRKISMELYGVETRLWKKGEDVPAIGLWNKEAASQLGNRDAFFAGMQPFLIDCLIKDQFFEKNEISAEKNHILHKLFPSSMELGPEEEEFFTLQIMNRSAILREHYNWFADFSVGSIRHKAIELYSKVGDLVYDVDCAGDQLESFPQQELVILSQLFTHISRILEMFAGNVECEEEEKTALNMSLEGMEYNFEDIRTRLKAAVERYQAGKFKIV